MAVGWRVRAHREGTCLLSKHDEVVLDVYWIAIADVRPLVGENGRNGRDSLPIAGKADMGTQRTLSGRGKHIDGHIRRFLCAGQRKKARSRWMSGDIKDAIAGW